MTQATDRGRAPLPYAMAVIALLLVAAVAAIYARTFYFNWLEYDDKIYVPNNPDINGGLSLEGLRASVTHGLVLLWIPVTSISYMIGVSVHGLEPGGHHATNVVLHAVNAVLVLLVFRRLTGGLWLSAMVAALFAVHPLNAEVVSWISSRKDLLAGLFWLLAMLAYFRHADAPSAPRLILVFVLYFLGVGGKVSAIMLPAVLLVLDWQPLQRLAAGRGLPRRLLALALEKLPMAGIAVLVTWAALKLHQDFGGFRDFDMTPMSIRATNAIYIYAFYVLKFLLPMGLTVEYPYLEHGPPFLPFLASFAMLAGISYACFRFRARMPLLPGGWLWYVLALLPSVGLARVPSFLTADRYLYVPMLGLCLMAAALFKQLANARPAWVKPAALLGAAWAGMLGAACYVQSGYWRNDLSLWKHASEVYPDSTLTLNGYGTALLFAKRIPEAETVLLRASAIPSPYRFLSVMNLVAIAEGAHDWPRALGFVRDVLTESPAHQPAYEALTRVLEGAAADAVEPAKRTQLEREVKIAKLQAQIVAGENTPPKDGMKPDPLVAEAYGHLAMAFLKKKNVEDALSMAGGAGMADPKNPRYPDLLGRGYVLAGQNEKAANFFKVSLRFDPGYIPALVNLASLDAVLHNKDGREAFEQALKKDPSNAELRKAYDQVFGAAAVPAAGN